MAGSNAYGQIGRGTPKASDSYFAPFRASIDPAQVDGLVQSAACGSFSDVDCP
jgi:hypothetical protein